MAVAERKVEAAIFRCADLATIDRPRVWDAMAKEIGDAKKAFGLGAVGDQSASSTTSSHRGPCPFPVAASLADQGADIHLKPRTVGVRTRVQRNMTGGTLLSPNAEFYYSRRAEDPAAPLSPNRIGRALSQAETRGIQRGQLDTLGWSIHG